MYGDLPASTQIAILALQLGFILFAARFCGNLAKKLNIPSVLGELIAGIIIGPYLLGKIGLPIEGLEHGLFQVDHGVPGGIALYSLATLGSIILLFMSGLETDLRMFFRYSVVGTAVGLGGVIFSFIFGEMLGMWLFDSSLSMASFMDPRCLFFGILSTATSVGITARILSEKRSIDSPEGTTILAAAVIDDVLGIICLAIVMGIVSAETGNGSGMINWGKISLIAVKSFGIWLGVTLLGLVCAYKVARFLKLFRPAGVFSILAFGLALLLSGIFEECGLAMIIGAYVMGLSLSKTDIAFSIQKSLHGLYDFLVPVFFVVMGMLVDVSVMGNGKVLMFGLLYATLAILAKVIGCALPAYFMNFNLLGSLRIGAGMVPRGEVALIIAGIGATTMMTMDGVQKPIIDPEMFGIAIIMTLITTLAAPPLLNFLLNIKGKGVRVEKADTENIHTSFTMPSETVCDFVLNALVVNFRKEGFLHSELSSNMSLVNFRHETKTFTLKVENNVLTFDSSAADIALIRTVMYETTVELHQNLEKLKSLALLEMKPADLLPDAKVAAMAKAAAPKKREKSPLRPERIIPEYGVITDLKATTTTDAIKELIQALNLQGQLKDVDLCINDVLEREQIVGTYLPGGIALPHGRTAGTTNLLAAIGISKKGCPHDGDDELTHIFVLSLCPKDSDGPYLQFIAQVANILADGKQVEQLLKLDDPAEVRKLFTGK